MSYRVEKDVMVPMPDGQTLATDLWIPDGGPAPALLVRTPYGKDVPNLLGNTLSIQALVKHGERPGLTTSDRAWLVELEREVGEHD